MTGSSIHSYIKLPRAATIGPWALPALCRAYNWPTNSPGGGIIAIGELGGGWVQSDIDAFASMIGMPPPSITDVTVSGSGNNKNPSDDASGEVALDIMVAAASYWMATSKPATIRVYWASNAMDSIPAATQRAAADGCDVFSWSWGADERNTGRPSCLAMEQVAHAAIALGMVTFAAAGDNDSSDGGPNAANVDNPASCPHVIGCGGTMKTLSLETVWNDNPGNPTGEGTGGGFSIEFPPLAWQNGAPHGRGRMVPDVAANAEPRTGYEIVLGGQQIVVGGTSAVAPLYAGLFAAFGKKLGKVNPDGVGPKLWMNHLAFNDISQGNNGYYRARPGPDACTGLGSPIGARIAALFK